MGDQPNHVKLTAHVAVAPQIAPDDMQAIADAGYQVVINNRPDGEAMGQPSSQDLQAAAESAGLEYVFYPLNAFNYPGSDLPGIAAMFDNDARPVFAFCRSGTRSCNLWISSREPAQQDEARAHAQRLGFDVSMSFAPVR